MSESRGLASRIVGQQFGLLTVLETQPTLNSKGEASVKAWCRCACGTEKGVDPYALVRGATKSCGCDRSSYVCRSGASSTLFKGHGEIGISLWNRYRQHARERNRTFEITIEYGWDLYLRQDRRCALTGVVIEFGSLKRNPRACRPSTASLDRIDGDVGYVEGNVQWVHKRINLMRNVIPVEDFVRWCTQIADHATRSSPLPTR